MKLRPLLFLALLTATASAQRDTAGAQTLFDQARDAMKRGDYVKACPKLAESNRLDPQPGTLANLAVCEEKSGMIASAWTHARDAIEELGSGDERAQALRALIGRVEKRLPKLVVRLAPEAPKGTRVTKDDVELSDASLGEPLPVDPGQHVVSASAPGRRDNTITVTVAEGEVKEVRLAPSDPDSAPPPVRTERPPPTASGGDKTLGYLIGAVGVVGVVAAAYEYSRVRSGKNAATRCSVGHACASADDVSAANGAHAAAVGFYVTGAVAVVGLGVGAFLLLSTSPGGGEVSVSVGPRGVGVGGMF